MPQRIFNREQSRRVDELAIGKYGISGLVLMENAGRGAVDVLERLGLGVRFAVCCGKGNNGGDGFVMARHLHARGYDVTVLLFGDAAELTGDAETNFDILDRTDVPIEEFGLDYIDDDDLDKTLKGFDVVIDALLGTGARGEPRPPFDRIIDAINRQPSPVVAVDLPSGLDCDTGVAAKHTIRAAHTLTFVAPKPGFFVTEAKPYVGQLHVVNLGLPPALLDEIAK
jgi:NAD(P)H-hydrate epimerase